jgi:hypothetical protein
VNAQDSRGWQELTLQRPLRVIRGDSIWLAFLFEDPQQKYYYKRFSDKDNEAFENRVWASTTKWGDVKGGFLPGSPPGSIKDYLVCMFTEVVFDTGDPD